MDESKEMFMATFEQGSNGITLPFGIFSSPEKAIEALQDFHEGVIYTAHTDEVDIEEELSYGDYVDIPVTEKDCSGAWEYVSTLHLYPCELDKIASEAYNY